MTRDLLVQYRFTDQKQAYRLLKWALISYKYELNQVVRLVRTQRRVQRRRLHPNKR